MFRKISKMFQGYRVWSEDMEEDDSLWQPMKRETPKEEREPSLASESGVSYSVVLGLLQ